MVNHMTDRAEIERLLQMTGRTLEGLPTQDDYWYSDDYVDRNEEIGMMMYRSGFKRNEPYIMHQSDVIELLVGALRDALDKRDAALEKVPKWRNAKERQPAPLEKVWMYSKKFNSMFVGMRGLQNPEHIYIESGPDLRLKDISYWMPKPQKPEPPEEEG